MRLSNGKLFRRVVERERAAEELRLRLPKDGWSIK